MKEFEHFIAESRQKAAGWIGFYWGKPPALLRQAEGFAAAVMLQWLRYFQEQGPRMTEIDK